ELARVSKPCPFCGEFGSSRGVWLSLEALKLLELAFAQDLNSEDGHRAAFLFLGSRFEVMIADILETLVEGHGPSNRLGEMVLDRLKKDRCNPVATAPGTDLIDVDTTFHSRYVGSEHEEANRYGTLRCNVRVTGSDGNEVSTGSGSDRVTRGGLHSSSKSGSS